MPFPFHLPFPTSLYMCVYLIGLVLHWVFMHYVLAGTGYLVFCHLLPGDQSAPRFRSPPARLLADWMPFAISAAITAGVAPLLFVQVLYQHSFYSANLLLFHRWMSILPVLILGFYMAYVLRTERLIRRGWIVRAAVALVTLACFAWTAWAWTENHLLSLDHRAWSRMYADGEMRYRSLELLPRLLLWFSLSAPTMCVILTMQLNALHDAVPADGSQRRGAMRRLALVGLAAVVICMTWYVIVIGSTARSALIQGRNIPHVILLLAGMGGQAYGWMRYRTPIADRSAFRWIVAANVVSLASAGSLREVVRMSRVDFAEQLERHREAGEVGGWMVFVVFLLVNTGAIVAVFRLVQNRANRST